MTTGKTTPNVNFLIAGMARSGTTLLQRMASELTSVWVPQETHFWRHAAALSIRYSWPLDRSEADDAITWLNSRESLQSQSLDRQRALDALADETYLWDLFRAVVVGLSPPDAGVLGEKTPDHLLWAEQLLEAVGDLKLIGVIRDPREVLRSHRTVPWGIHDPGPLAEKWVHLTRCLEDCRSLYPDRVLTIRYEDAVRSVDETRMAIAELLGVRDEFEDVSNRQSSLFPDSEWWKVRSIGPVEWRPETWQETLSLDETKIIENRAASLMETWGYRPASKSRGKICLTTTTIEMRRAVRRASNQTLPITSAHLDEWNRIDKVRANRWAAKARKLQESNARLETRLRSEASARRATEETLAELTALHDDTVRRLERTEEERWAWEARASDAQRTQQRAELARLKAERRYQLATARFRRLRARRWWRLGGVLSRWRSAPWRVVTLFREGWHTAFGPSEMPEIPDVRPLEARITKLETELAASPSKGLEAARRAFDAGAYEEAMSLVEQTPENVRTSAEALMLINGCYVRMGELTAGLKTMRALLRHKPDAKLNWQARFQVGRLIETDPFWLPDAGLPPPPKVASRPRTVLHLLKESFPYFERGYTVRSHTTLLAQRHAGYEPAVVTSLGFPRGQGFAKFPLYEEIDGIPHYRLDLGSAYPLNEVPFDHLLSDQAMLTAQLATDVRPALVQAGSGYRGYETALVGLAVARYLNVPMIYEIRSFLEQTWTGDVERAERGEYYRRRYEQELRCLTEADHVITIAESMRDEIIGRGVPAERISVVPNVVDIDRFFPRPKAQKLLTKYGLGDTWIIGYISNLGFREGIENLIRAVFFLRKAGLNVKGLVVGDGPEHQFLRSLVEKLDLSEEVILTGHVPNAAIEDHYALIDLFVVPRIDDRAARLVTPLKPLEAMAMGVPVIAADLPALRELVAPGLRGEVFRPSDPAHLAEVAGELLTDDVRRRDYAAAGRTWVESERTLEANAQRYRVILEAILEGPS